MAGPQIHEAIAACLRGRPAEQVLLQPLLDRLAAGRDVTDGTEFHGHMTSSGVVNDYDEGLLIHHKASERRIQSGGEDKYLHRRHRKGRGGDGRFVAARDIDDYFIATVNANREHTGLEEIPEAPVRPHMLRHTVSITVARESDGEITLGLRLEHDARRA
ncbi:hypothetical protein [Streptomyces broussonetiae]|uniref:Uncharacterized protein n=2 Tax=Streptomyces broussonetiae TaxID=2686304 RepID=A0A6I6MTV8_9ACTN|nr:hypothetical protein GQF42_03340 [Streptomyces broussonetiae]